jgi:hypothetical protein
MTGEQGEYLSSLLQGLGPEANQALMGLLGGMDPDKMQELFQTSFIDPAMQTYEQQVLPGIQQRFVDANAGSSSALNQALGQSANDLTTMLGSQMGQFAQGQQQNSLQALGLGNQALGQKQFDPIIQQREGILGPLIGAAGQAAAGAASSRSVKENIVNFDKGLELVKGMDVKQYDYTGKFADRPKGRLGLIAEDAPKEVQEDVEGVLGIDVYGLLSIAINAIKELSGKVEALEAR